MYTKMRWVLISPNKAVAIGPFPNKTAARAYRDTMHRADFMPVALLAPLPREGK